MNLTRAHNLTALHSSRFQCSYWSGAMKCLVGQLSPQLVLWVEAGSVRFV